VGADYSVLSELEPSSAAMMASAMGPFLESHVPAAHADLLRSSARSDIRARASNNGGRGAAGLRTRSSRRELVFVDQSAEQAASPDAIEINDVSNLPPVARRRHRERRQLTEWAVRPVLVVMGDVRGEDVVEVSTTDDQQPIEALAACAADPAFRVRSYSRRPHRRLITRMPCERKTSSNSPANLLSRSRTRNSGRTSSSSRTMSRLRDCCVTERP